ncbi:Nuclear transport factor 2, eukaryote,NTF2-like domain [Cinara cedri]|uniref:Nuclear transport factor 2, eukaryote,NTF2-like domain n=1 Tax=Cinara cedri TaxID=506608 RepID=A0A5E4NSM3_9HEMI|nr:Nuclear transport factor 2, eukaryote,NTF2-like domain [Cinara cedri]
MSAAEVGFRFAQHYDSMLNTNPQDAFIIYDKLGDYRTIYEDGTLAIAKKRKELERIVITSVTSSNISVNLLYLETGGHSVEHLLIMVIGERFRYVISMDCRPNRGMLYAIVRSVMQYFSVNQPTQVTTFNVAYDIQENTDNHKIEATSMTQADISNNVAAYNNPLSNTIKINTYNAIKNVQNPTKSILKGVKKITEIATTSQISNDTVMNDANYEKSTNITLVSVRTSASEIGFRFAQIYYATLSTKPENAYLFYNELGEYRTTYEDGTSVLAKNWKEINSVLMRPLTGSDIFVKSITSEPRSGSLENLLITVTGVRFTHVFVANYRPKRGLRYAIVKSIKQYFPANQQPQRTAFDVGNNIAVNTNNPEPAGKKKVKISDDIATYNNPSCNAGNIKSYNTIKNVKNPPKSILKRVTSYTNITDPFVPSRDTLKINSCNAMTNAKNPPRDSLKGVTKSTETDTTSRQSTDTVNNDANYEKTANKNLDCVETSATEIGIRFTQLYYATLSTKPQNAYLFFDELGEHRTISENGTSVLAKNWNEIKSALLNPANLSDNFFKSITSQPVSGSLENLLITVTGIRFTHVFVALMAGFAPDAIRLVKSIKQYFFANQQPQVTTFTAGNNFAENTDNHEPTGKKQENILDDIATCNEPSCNASNIDTYNAITTGNNPPKGILKRGPKYTELATTSKLSHDTVNNDTNYEKNANKNLDCIETSATELGFRFAQIYYATLSTKPENAYLFYNELGEYRTTYEDGTSVLSKNWKEINSVLMRPLTGSDIFVKSITSEPRSGSLENLLITVTGVRFMHVFVANYRPNRGLRYAIVKSIKQYFPSNQQPQVTNVTAGENFAENTDNHESAGKKQANFLDDIATKNELSCNAGNINTYNAIKNPPKNILKRVTSYTNITDPFVPSRDTLKKNSCNAMTIAKNPPRDSLKGVTKSTETDTTSRQSTDTVNNDANYEKTANKNLVCVETSATELGIRFAQLYYATLSTKPQNAYLFYDELGEYRTISEDGTSVLAKNWNEIKNALLNPANLSDIFFKSICRVGQSPSNQNLLITVTGVRFTHVFVANYRPKRGLGYAIVKSLKQYFFTNQPPQITAFDVGNNIAVNTNNPEPAGKKQEDILDDIATCNEPSCNASNIDTYNAITTGKNPPKGILKRVTASKLSHDTVNNYANHDRTANNPLKGILKHGPKYTELATTSKLSHDTVKNDANHEMTAKKPLKGILKRGPKYTELATTSKLSHDTVKNDANHEITAKKPLKGILKRGPKSTELATTSELSQDTVNNDAYHEITAKKPLKGILKRGFKSTELATILKPSYDTKNNNANHEITAKNPLKDILNRGSKTTEIATKTKPSRDTVNDDANHEITVENPPKVILNRVTSCTEIATTSNPSRDTGILKRGPKSTELATTSELSQDTVNNDAYHEITAKKPLKGILKRGPKYTEQATTSKLSHDTVNNYANHDRTAKNPLRGILKRGPKYTELATTSKLSHDTVNNDTNYEKNANKNLDCIETSATELGFRFAQIYYATLSTKPENAYLFYNELGEYRTTYEDGTSVLAKNWKEINSVLMRPLTGSDIFVKSITSEPRSGSLENLLITVTGVRFTHVFVANYRPKRGLRYAIVKSIKQYFPANQQPQRTAFDVGNNIAVNTNNPEPAGKKKVKISDDIATYNNPSCNAGNIKSYNTIKNVKNPPKSILKRVTSYTNITDPFVPSRDTLKINSCNAMTNAKNPPRDSLKGVTKSTETDTTSRQSTDTVNNDANYEKTANKNLDCVETSATEIGIRFAQLYYATLSTKPQNAYLFFDELGEHRTISENGTSVLAKNWNEIKSALLNPANLSDNFFKSITSQPVSGSLENLLITVTGIRFTHVFVANYRPKRGLRYAIVKSIKQYFFANQQPQVTTFTAGNNFAENTDNHEPTGEKQENILDDIATCNEPSCNASNIDTYNAITTGKNPPKGILKRVTASKLSHDTVNNYANHDRTANNPLKGILKRGPKSTELATTSELSQDTVNNDAYHEITAKKPLKGILKRGFKSTELATTSKLSHDTVKNDANHEITAKKPLLSHDTVKNDANHEITAKNPLKDILNRGSKTTEIATKTKPSRDTVNDDANHEITVENPPKVILNRVTSCTEIATTSNPSRDTVNNDLKHEITANNTSIGVKTSATEESFKFAQRYYATLETEKKLAYLFYEEHGEYRTIYEDGTSVLATNWEEINSVILRPGTFSDIFVKSITSEPYGGSLDELLITVIGIRFKHVFIVRYCPNREIHCAIVKSVKQYFPAN